MEKKSIILLIVLVFSFALYGCGVKEQNRINDNVYLPVDNSINPAANNLDANQITGNINDIDTANSDLNITQVDADLNDLGKTLGSW